MKEVDGFIKDMFARMNLQQIREFLLCGAEDEHVVFETYDIWLKRESEPIYNRISNLYPDEAENDRAANDLSQALSAHDAIYMELGMKAGARLIYQLLIADDQPFIRK